MNLKFKYVNKSEFNFVDMEFIKKLRSHPDILKQVFEHKKITSSEQEYWFEHIYKVQDNYHIWIIYDESKNSSIGYVTIITNLIHKRCQFDYFISPEMSFMKYDISILKWIFKYVKIIDDAVDMHKIWTYVLIDNKDKINILNDFGLNKEAKLKNHIFKNNKYMDVLIYSFIYS